MSGNRLMNMIDMDRLGCSGGRPAIFFADKAFIATALIGLSMLEKMPWWVTLVILAREIGVTILRFAVINRGVIAASKGGKIKSLLQNFSVGFYMLPLPEALHTPRDILLGIAIILTLTSGLQYFREVLKCRS